MSAFDGSGADDPFASINNLNGGGAGATSTDNYPNNSYPTTGDAGNNGTNQQQQPEILYYQADDGNYYAYYYDEAGNIVYPDFYSGGDAGATGAIGATGAYDGAGGSVTGADGAYYQGAATGQDNSYVGQVDPNQQQSPYGTFPDQYNADPYNAEQYNANTYSAEQYNADPYSTDPYNPDQYNTGQYNADQYNNYGQADYYQYPSDQDPSAAASNYAAETSNTFPADAFNVTDNLTVNDKNALVDNPFASVNALNYEEGTIVDLQKNEHQTATGFFEKEGSNVKPVEPSNAPLPSSDSQANASNLIGSSFFDNFNSAEQSATIPTAISKTPEQSLFNAPPSINDTPGTVTVGHVDEKDYHPKPDPEPEHASVAANNDKIDPLYFKPEGEEEKPNPEPVPTAEPTKKVKDEDGLNIELDAELDAVLKDVEIKDIDMDENDDLDLDDLILGSAENIMKLQSPTEPPSTSPINKQEDEITFTTKDVKEEEPVVASVKEEEPKHSPVEKRPSIHAEIADALLSNIMNDLVISAAASKDALSIETVVATDNSNNNQEPSASTLPPPPRTTSITPHSANDVASSADSSSHRNDNLFGYENYLNANTLNNKSDPFKNETVIQEEGQSNSAFQGGDVVPAASADQHPFTEDFNQNATFDQQPTEENAPPYEQNPPLSSFDQPAPYEQVIANDQPAPYDQPTHHDQPAPYDQITGYDQTIAAATAANTETIADHSAYNEGNPAVAQTAYDASNFNESNTAAAFDQIGYDGGAHAYDPNAATAFEHTTGYDASTAGYDQSAATGYDASAYDQQQSGGYEHQNVGYDHHQGTGYDQSGNYDHNTAGYDQTTAAYDQTTGYDQNTGYVENVGYDQTPGYDQSAAYDQNAVYDQSTGVYGTYDASHYDQNGTTYDATQYDSTQYNQNVTSYDQGANAMYEQSNASTNANIYTMSSRKSSVGGGSNRATEKVSSVSPYPIPSYLAAQVNANFYNNGSDQSSDVSSEQGSFSSPLHSGFQNCPKCNRKNGMDFNFCAKCGTPLTGIRNPASSGTGGGVGAPNAGPTVRDDLSAAPSPFSFVMDQNINNVNHLNQPQNTNSPVVLESPLVLDSPNTNATPTGAEGPSITKPFYPLAAFGFGGNLILIFPRRQQRFNGTGSTANATYSYFPGLVHVKRLREVPNFEERVIKPFTLFPGPLSTPFNLTVTATAKKPQPASSTSTSSTSSLSSKVISAQGKNNLNLNKYLTALEQAKPEYGPLCSVFRILVEFDGSLSANPKAREKLIEYLEGKTSASSSSFTTPTSSMDRPVDLASPEKVAALEGQIEALLKRGDREAACDIAVREKLWAHALLISSNIDRETYFGVIKSFCQGSFALGTPLRLLYLLYGGQSKLAIEELSTNNNTNTNGGGGDIPQSLLVNWQSTLLTILKNNFNNEPVVLRHFGDGLGKIGNVLGAHFCYLLATFLNDSSAGGSSNFAECFDGYVESTANSPSVASKGRVTLLGLSKRDIEERGCRPGYTCPIESFQLTELVEYLRQLDRNVKAATANPTSTSSTSTAPSASTSANTFMLPYLQAYKYAYACTLAELGQCEDSLRYCESIGTILSNCKLMSPHFHRFFFQNLGSLNERLLGHGVTLSSSGGGSAGGSTFSASASSGMEMSKWLTKGLMDVFDRSLSKVIGVDEKSVNSVNGSNAVNAVNTNHPSNVNTNYNANNNVLFSNAIMTSGSGTNTPPIQPSPLQPNMHSHHPMVGSGVGGVASSSIAGGNSNSNSNSRVPMFSPSTANNNNNNAGPLKRVQSDFSVHNSSNSSFGQSGQNGISNLPKMIPLVPNNTSNTNANNNINTFNNTNTANGNGNEEFISTGSVPMLSSSTAAATWGAKSAQSVMMKHSTASASAGDLDEDEDLGFGNSSTLLRKKKQQQQQSESNDNSNNSNANSNASNDEKDQKFNTVASSNYNNNNKSGYFSLLSGWFRRSSSSGNVSSSTSESTGPDGKKVYRANLGQENTMVYDPTLKRWLMKGGNPPEGSDGGASSSTPVGPPPILNNNTSSTTTNSPAPPIPGGAAASVMNRPGTTPPMMTTTNNTASPSPGQFRRGVAGLRGAKKYVDPFKQPPAPPS